MKKFIFVGLIAIAFVAGVAFAQTPITLGQLQDLVTGEKVKTEALLAAAENLNTFVDTHKVFLNGPVASALNSQGAIDWDVYLNTQVTEYTNILNSTQTAIQAFGLCQ